MENWSKNSVAELQNEEVYRALFDSRCESIFIGNFDGALLKINKAASRLFGYTEDEFKHLGKYCVLDETDPRSANAYRQREIHGHYTGEVTCIKKNGEAIPCHISSTSVELSDGAQHFFTILTDISARKAAERDMDLLLSNTHEGFMVVDKQLKVVTFNHQLNMLYQEYLGIEIYKGAPLLNYAIQGKEELFEIIQEVLAGHRHEREVKLTKPDGNALYYAVQYKPAYERSGELIGVVISSTDVTQRRKANEKILMDKERYDLAAKATNDAIYDWDIISNSVYWGEGFTKLFGYDNYDEIYPIETWIKNIHPDDFYQTVNGMRHVIYSTAELQWQGEYRYMRADGTYAAILDRGFVIRNEAGKAMRMIGAMQDITLRKENEKTLQLLNEQLKKRADQLAISNEELEQFAYIASHDLQEPLRMITSFLTQLEKKYDGLLDEKARKYIWFAVDGAIRMRQIIYDLLEYSLMGRPGNDRSTIDMNAMVNDILHMHRTLIEENNAVVEVTDLPEIIGSKIHMEHVFINLISNAVKYRYPDRAPRITIRGEDQPDYWQFSISDNGIGIQQEFYQKIFIIFQRLHNREQYSGTGVGLAICKKIIENHNGRIWVESEPGNGSVFYFTIRK